MREKKIYVRKCREREEGQGVLETRMTLSISFFQGKTKCVSLYIPNSKLNCHTLSVCLCVSQ